MNNWRFDQRDRHWTAPELSGCTVTSLTETHINTQLRSHEILLEEEQLQRRNFKRPPSLTALSAGKINEMLEVSDNFIADIHTIAKSVNSGLLREVLGDPRTSYLVLRAFLALPPGYGPGNAAETVGSIRDIDEAIITNEKYIRSRGVEKNKDGKGLVSLDYAHILFGMPPSGASAHPLTIRRKDPPKGGFEILDEKRAREIQIQPNSKAFAETFDRITQGILHGLDWSNIFVAGGIALTALLHVDPSEDSKKEVKDNDVDIYIYGLGPREANEKVKHIFEVWRSNLPADNKQQIVVKNSKTINFLADYPNRRIQIVLKLVRSPTQVLLNFDLDACALGFDGKEVLMLPRCARAIETGYSTFTMDLIWGHHLGDRRATQEIRVFKYADRGFGLRILPSYARSLEDTDRRQMKLAGLISAENQEVDEIYPVEDELPEPRPARPGFWAPPNKNRKPNGPEPGLKTLKRIAYLGQEFVHLYYFGVTPLRQCPDHEDPETWQECYEELKRGLEGRKAENERRRAAGEPLEVPLISLNCMDTRDMHFGLPGGRSGLGGFELF
ncbi:hypothetical protein MMC16_006758 [Acarospora aff. strigata]|nr:hypothetical protein [Acarospora aff. strigata]